MDCIAFWNKKVLEEGYQSFGLMRLKNGQREITSAKWIFQKMLYMAFKQ